MMRTDHEKRVPTWQRWLCGVLGVAGALVMLFVAGNLLGGNEIPGNLTGPVFVFTPLGTFHFAHVARKGRMARSLFPFFGLRH